MISHDKRCIFVHIPKTGGTSVEDAIWGPDRSARTAADLWYGHIAPDRNKYQADGLQHLLATQIRQEVGSEVFDSYFKFSFVRNPWDRCVSEYAYMRERPDLRDLIGMRADCSFPDFLRLIQQVEHVHWYEQCQFVMDEDGRLLVDFLGRFESFEADLRGVLCRLGVEASTIPHEMKGGRGPYQDYYDAASRDVVARLYRRDIESFGYSFADHGGPMPVGMSNLCPGPETPATCRRHAQASASEGAEVVGQLADLFGTGGERAESGRNRRA